MASPGGKSAGRVSVRVVPDATSFRADLKKLLERAEKQSRVSIRVTADTKIARLAIDRLTADVAKNPAMLNVVADTRDAVRRVNDLSKDLKATVNADADTGLARTKLITLTKPRVVQILANLNKSSVAGVGAALARLSGARVASDMVQKLGTNLSNLDKSVPKLAAVSLGIAGITSTLLSASQGLITVGAGLASVAGAGIALPGIIAGGAIALGVFAAAAKDAKTVLADLGPQFSSLQDSISAGFWRQAAAPIRELATSLMPSLRTELTGVATSLGSFTGAWAGAVQASLTAKVLGPMMQNLRSGIDAAKAGVEPLVQAFTTLGTVGATYLPGLGKGFSDLSAKFNSFVQGASEDGSLTKWVNSGLAALQQIGSVVGSTAKILGGLFTAADAAGGGGLEALASTLSRVADIVNKQPFQGALTQIFVGAGKAMEGLSAALAPIGDMFVALAPTISGVLATAGSALGSLLGSIADALSQPAFATGLSAFFDGIAAGIAGIGPALPAIAVALGALGQVAGTYAATIGPVLGAVFQALAPVVTTLALAIQPLIPMLGDLLIQAINGLAPILMSIAGIFPGLVQAILPLMPMFSDLIGSLLPPLAELFAAMAPLVVQIVKAFLPLLPPILDLITDLLPPLIGIFTDLMPIISDLVAAIAPLIKIIADNMTMTFKAIMPLVKNTFTQISTIIGGVMKVITGIIKVATGLLSGNWKQAWDGVKDILSGVWDAISGVIKLGVGNLMGLVEGIFPGIKDKMAGASALLRDSGKKIIDGLVAGIRGAIANVKAAVGDVMQAARNLLPFSPAKEGPFSGKGWTLYSGQAISESLADGIRQKQDKVRSAAQSLAEAAHPDIRDSDMPGLRSEDGGGSGGVNVNQYVSTSDPRAAAHQAARLITGAIA